MRVYSAHSTAWILPIGLAWKTRQANPNLPYRVIGGNVTLVIALVIGVIIMIDTILNSSRFIYLQ